MFDSLVEFFTLYPYLGVAVVFLACGLGLPLPEEIVLVAAGYISYQSEHVALSTMMVACAIAILAGDVIPFALGRTLGPRLLRLRPMRLVVTPQRLARFDRWFRRRGDLVIFISRFVAGIRVVAFFTAGTMRVSWTRFILLDVAGIAIIVPPLVYVGNHFADTIDRAIGHVQRVERGIVFATVAAGVVLGIWFWLKRRRRQRQLVGEPVETYVEPSTPVRDEAGDEAGEAGASDDR